MEGSLERLISDSRVSNVGLEKFDLGSKYGLFVRIGKGAELKRHAVRLSALPSFNDALDAAAEQLREWVNENG